MAAHAAPLAEEVLALADGPADVTADQDHVGGVTGLASSFRVFLGEERPQPVLVVAMCFFDTGGGAAIALVAGRTAELVGIVNFQKLGRGMADEGAVVIVGLLLLVVLGEGGGGNLQGLADAHVGGLAAVNDVGVGDINLLDLGIPVGVFLFQALDLGGSEIDGVIGNVLRSLGAGVGDWLEDVAQFGADLGALVLERVIFFLQLLEVVLLAVAVGECDVPLFVFVVGDFVLQLLLARGIGRGLNLVGEGVDVGALVSEDALHGEDLGAEVGDFFLQFVLAGTGRFGSFLGGLVELLIVGALQDFVERLLGSGVGLVEEGGVARPPVFLEGFPGALSPELVCERPEKGADEEDERHHVIHGVGLGYDRILLGDRLFRHHILQEQSSVKPLSALVVRRWLELRRCAPGAAATAAPGQCDRSFVAGPRPAANGRPLDVKPRRYPYVLDVTK